MSHKKTKEEVLDELEAKLETEKAFLKGTIEGMKSKKLIDSLTTPAFRTVIYRWTIVVAAVSLLGFLTWDWTHYDFIIHVVVILDYLVVISIFHESIHHWMANKLGYKCTWYKEKGQMGFDIDHEDDERWKKDIVKIAFYPYVIIFPISIAVVTVGYFFNQVGLLAAGVLCTILHIICITLEGKNVEVETKAIHPIA